VRFGEDALIPVRRAVEQPELVAGFDLLAGDFGVLGGEARELQHRRGPSHELLDRPGDSALEVLHQPVALCRVVRQRQHRVRCRLFRGVVSGGGEQDQERADLLVENRRVEMSCGLYSRTCGELATVTKLA
jgi:hypothetical protein